MYQKEYIVVPGNDYEIVNNIIAVIILFLLILQ